MPSIGQNLQPFTGNDDVSIWVKNSRVGRKTKTNKNYKYIVSGPDHHMSPWTRNIIYFRIFRLSGNNLFQLEFANEIFLVGTMQEVIVNLIAHKGKEYLSAANSYNIYFLLYLLAFLEKLRENKIISFDISRKERFSCTLWYGLLLKAWTCLKKGFAIFFTEGTFVTSTCIKVLYTCTNAKATSIIAMFV